jgi:hypothetical protein
MVLGLRFPTPFLKLLLFLKVLDMGDLSSIRPGKGPHFLPSSPDDVTFSQMWDRFVILAGSEGAAQSMVTIVSLSMITTFTLCAVALRNNSPASMSFSQAWVASTKVSGQHVHICPH